MKSEKQFVLLLPLLKAEVQCSASRPLDHTLPIPVHGTQSPCILTGTARFQEKLVILKGRMLRHLRPKGFQALWPRWHEELYKFVLVSIMEG